MYGANRSVTVVIPYSPEHTTEEMLEEAKETVRNQTVETELLVIEDKNQRGPAWGRNQGLERAGSRYVAFLDADDLWRPDKIERQLSRFEETGAGLCVQGTPMSTKQFLFELFVGRRVMGLMSSVVIDSWQVTTRFEEELTRWEDQLFILESASESGACFCQDTFVQRDHEESITASYRMDTSHSSQQGEMYLSLVRERVPELRPFIGVWQLRLYAELMVMSLRRAGSALREGGTYFYSLISSVVEPRAIFGLFWTLYFFLRRPVSGKKISADFDSTSTDTSEL